MLKLFICGLLTQITTSFAFTSDYKYHSEAGAWFKLHKFAATWQHAFSQCHYEGAQLASPTSEAMLEAIRSIHDGPGTNVNRHYIGTHSMFSPGHFVSLEGVPLINMPVMNTVQVLNREDGECLTMYGDYISAESCTQQLPYICYRRNIPGQNNTECGTFDTEYEFESTTGSCYKVHDDLRTWSEANSMCISEGGHLAILNDEKEADVVLSIVADSTSNSTEFIGAFIGLRDWDESGTWLSIHAEPVQQLYNNWYKYPKNDTFEFIDQHCGAIFHGGEIGKVPCDLTSIFVCEKDPQNVRFILEN